MALLENGGARIRAGPMGRDSCRRDFYSARIKLMDMVTGAYLRL